MALLAVCADVELAGAGAGAGADADPLAEAEADPVAEAEEDPLAEAEEEAELFVLAVGLGAGVELSQLGPLVLGLLLGLELALGVAVVVTVGVLLALALALAPTLPVGLVLPVPGLVAESDSVAVADRLVDGVDGVDGEVAGVGELSVGFGVTEGDGKDCGHDAFGVGPCCWVRVLATAAVALLPVPRVLPPPRAAGELAPLTV